MNKNVVLIADRVADFDNINIQNRNLECIPSDYFNQVIECLTKICPHVTHYNSPKDFCNNLKQHKSDIILSIWSGIGSTFRKCLVPSICEASDICYVGADPYVHIVCQDKYITKLIASQFKIKSAKSILIYSITDKKEIYQLNLPLVVKPNYEGGSNGISQQNLVFTYEDAILLINKLLQYFHQPIIVEEYIEGYELCTSIIGTQDKIDLIDASQLIIEDCDFFERTLYGFESKVQNISNRKLISASHFLTQELIESFSKIFFSIGKTELLRIDGRINKKGEFYLIELTPDAYLGKRGSTAFCAKQNNISYEEMLEMLLENAVIDYEQRKKMKA